MALLSLILGSLSGPFSVVPLVKIMVCSGGSGKCGLKGCFQPCLHAYSTTNKTYLLFAVGVRFGPNPTSVSIMNPCKVEAPWSHCNSTGQKMTGWGMQIKGRLCLYIKGAGGYEFWLPGNSWKGPKNIRFRDKIPGFKSDCTVGSWVTLSAFCKPQDLSFLTWEMRLMTSAQDCCWD